MPQQPEFPHLLLAFKGSYDPRFNGGREKPAEVETAEENPRRHSARLEQSLDELKRSRENAISERADQGLPAIPADTGVLMRLPEGTDAEGIAHMLGVELVAETAEGLMLVSSQDISFQQVRDVLAQFAAGTGGKVAGSSLQEIIYKPDDQRRLDAILGAEVEALWPLIDDTTYVLDLGIQTATSTRQVSWPPVRKRASESAEDFIARQQQARAAVWQGACMEWDEKADERVNELRHFIQHYAGEIIQDITSDQPSQSEDGMVFPDSVQVRVRLSGRGFRDVILNFAHLFDVELPPEIQAMTVAETGEVPPPPAEILPPPHNAPHVCIIDSGIQEEHRLLAPAIHWSTSQCFLPGVVESDVADYVPPRGHGTRVAGAVLYPHAIPLTGQVQPVAWLQNARVLDAGNSLPHALPPEKYLQQVVTAFHTAPEWTKIYNHSINASVPCTKKRMSSWAAKLDQLSHEHDILFIQSAGNQQQGVGTETNPGLRAHLQAGLQPPAHQLKRSMRIANPAQSLHALTVGSISPAAYEDDYRRSFARVPHHPSGFSRGGYGQPWDVVKPDVVEIGGDFVYSKITHDVQQHPDLSVELLNSTLHGAPAFSKDGVGTSFAAPKVAHIAAHLQTLFPTASPLLYRALIVQSARWPAWAEQEPDKGKVLRLIGYGLPSLERATSNTPQRITLITQDAVTLPSKKLHLYTVRIPEELRNAARETRLRLEITLAYTALPRRTRSSHRRYLETWLDWEASSLGEPADQFLHRMQNGGSASGYNFDWMLDVRRDRGDAQGTQRSNGTVQKDWAVFNAYDLPDEFSIAVRSHLGWNHLKGAASARYCLAVSFEAEDTELPVYSLIENAQVETEVEENAWQATP